MCLVCAAGPNAVNARHGVRTRALMGSLECMTAMIRIVVCLDEVGTESCTGITRSVSQGRSSNVVAQLGGVRVDSKTQRGSLIEAII